MTGEYREDADKAARVALKLGLDVADVCEGVLEHGEGFVSTLAYISDRFEDDTPPPPAPTPAPPTPPAPVPAQPSAAARARAARR